MEIMKFFQSEFNIDAVRRALINDGVVRLMFTWQQCCYVHVTTVLQLFEIGKKISLKTSLNLQFAIFLFLKEWLVLSKKWVKALKDWDRTDKSLPTARIWKLWLITSHFR